MDFKTQLEECDRLYDIGDYRGLIGKCDEMLAQFPDNPNAMGYKGIAHCFLGEYDEALEVLERAYELYPDNYYIINNLAVVHYDLGNFEKSLELCEEGLKIRNFEWLCENKFKNLLKLERFDEAFEFERDSEVNPHMVFLEGDMADSELDYYRSRLTDSPDDIYLIESIKMISQDCAGDVGDYYLEWIEGIYFPEGHLIVDCGKPELSEYAKFKMFGLTSAFNVESRCIGPAELKDMLYSFDDEEFEAFMKRMLFIGYLDKGEYGCFKQANPEYGLEELKKDFSSRDLRLNWMKGHEVTPELEDEFLDLLSDCVLIMGIDVPEGGIDVNAKDGPGFGIRSIEDDDGNLMVPLFTSDAIMALSDIDATILEVYLDDAADILRKTEGYSGVIIDPMTRHTLAVATDALLARFGRKTNLERIRNDRIKVNLEKTGPFDDLACELMNSNVIAACRQDEDGIERIFRIEHEGFLCIAIFTDIDEFNKAFENADEDVIAKIFPFRNMARIQNDKYVLNMASEAQTFDSHMILHFSGELF